MRTEINWPDVYMHIRRTSHLFLLVPRELRISTGTNSTLGITPKPILLKGGISKGNSIRSYGNATLEFVPRTTSVEGVDVNFSAPYGTVLMNVYLLICIDKMFMCA